MIDVGRQHLVGRQLLAAPADGAAHDEAFVQAHQVADEGALQQVVSDGDARGAQAGVVDRVVDERRVHHDIPVVGQVEVGAALLQLVEPRIGHPVGGALDGAIYIALDAVLQSVDRIDIGEFTVQPLGDHRFERPAQRAGQAREAEVRKHVEELAVGEKPVHDGRYFGVGIGADGFEFVHHVLVKEAEAAGMTRRHAAR